MSQVEAWMNRLTLKQKLGQMVMVRGYEFEDKIRKALPEGTIGAAATNIFVKKSRKLDYILESVNHYFRTSPVPILFECDPEWGLALTFDFGTSFTSMMALGATRSKDLAYRMGKVIGTEAKAIGFRMVGCPVLDVNTNPENPIVNTRAISDRVDLVIELGEHYMKGIQEAGVIALAKHFPGHGDTFEDSHVMMPTIHHSRERLWEVEFKPFAELIKKGLMGLMSAHILYPTMVVEGEEGLPATLSRTLMTDLPRKEMGFEGLIVSDSLTMKSIKDQYGIERAAIMAILAGNDIILQDYDSDPEITFQALEEAVRTGEITMDHVDSTVRRILTVKEQFGLLDNQLIDPAEAMLILECEAHLAVAKELADRAVTMLEAKHLPIREAKSKKVLLIAPRRDTGVSIEDSIDRTRNKVDYLFQQCQLYSDDANLCSISEYPTDEEIQQIVESLQANAYECVLYAGFTRFVAYGEDNGKIPQAQLKLIEQLRIYAPRFVFLIFGSPYMISKLEAFDNCLCMYSDDFCSLASSLKVVFGAITATGKLPVTLNDKYGFDYGL
jgi:beta-N-acetylhexosaminidase